MLSEEGRIAIIESCKRRRGEKRNVSPEGKQRQDEGKRRWHKEVGYSVKQREAARQRITARNKTEKARATSSKIGKITGPRNLVVYNKSEKGRKKSAEMGALLGAENIFAYDHSKIGIQRHREHTISYNKSQIGRENSRKQAKKLGPGGLIRYNKSEKGRAKSRENANLFLVPFTRSETGRKSASARMIKTRKKGYVKQTKIEKRIMQILLSWGVEVVLEKVFDGIGIVDFFCPKQRLCIEADGDYWHNLPGAKEGDARKDKSLMELGLRVLRLPEKIILNRDDIAMENIHNALAGV